VVLIRTAGSASFFDEIYGGSRSYLVPPLYGEVEKRAFERNSVVLRPTGILLSTPTYELATSRAIATLLIILFTEPPDFMVSL
jgi:hypothetical protein